MTAIMKSKRTHIKSPQAAKNRDIRLSPFFIKPMYISAAPGRSENIKVKNGIVCIIIFIISIVLLASAYYMVTGGINTLMQHEVSILLIPIGIGVVGTVLFF